MVRRAMATSALHSLLRALSERGVCRLCDPVQGETRCHMQSSLLELVAMSLVFVAVVVFVVVKVDC